MTSIGATDRAAPRREGRDGQLERIGWALFLIMIGGLALVPSEWVPEGTWLAGTGLIMIGLNIVRDRNALPVSSFSAVLGTIALAVGASAMTGAVLPVLPVLLAAVGLQTLCGVRRAGKGRP